MKSPKKVAFVVKRYARRKAKIRPYAVRKLKMKQYAVRKREGGLPSMIVLKALFCVVNLKVKKN